jgi:hypothetical protein
VARKTSHFTFTVYTDLAKEHWRHSVLRHICDTLYITAHLRHPVCYEAILNALPILTGKNSQNWPKATRWCVKAKWHYYRRFEATKFFSLQGRRDDEQRKTTVPFPNRTVALSVMAGWHRAVWQKYTFFTSAGMRCLHI